VQYLSLLSNNREGENKILKILYKFTEKAAKNGKIRRKIKFYPVLSLLWARNRENYAERSCFGFLSAFPGGGRGPVGMAEVITRNLHHQRPQLGPVSG
jgi:hypothetical protein